MTFLSLCGLFRVELIPMVSYFSDIVKDLVEKTDVATKALFESEAGTAAVSHRHPTLCSDRLNGFVFSFL